jgi:hypothetical protein
VESDIVLCLSSAIFCPTCKNGSNYVRVESFDFGLLSSPRRIRRGGTLDIHGAGVNTSVSGNHKGKRLRSPYCTFIVKAPWYSAGSSVIVIQVFEDRTILLIR